MKKIDLYIIRKFLTTFFFMLGVIMLIAVVFDVSEKIDDFISHKAPLSAIIIDYYLNFILYFGNLFSPLLIFISVIFFTSKMASNTEIVAILSSGVSFRRMLLPYFISATILAGIAFCLNHWIIPHANRTRLAFEESYLRMPYRNFDRNIHKPINPPDELIYFESYNAQQDIGYKFSYEKWEDGSLVYKMLADFARWDSSNQSWKVTNYQARSFDGMKESIKTGLSIDTNFGINPEEFKRRVDVATQSMNYGELNEFIERMKEEGNEHVPLYLIEKHSRTSLPFASYILTLIGVSISSRKVRGGIGAHLALGLFLCVSYILFMKVSAVYATNTGLDPLLSTWIPNIIFAGLSIYIFLKAPK